MPTIEVTEGQAKAFARGLPIQSDRYETISVAASMGSVWRVEWIDGQPTRFAEQPFRGWQRGFMDVFTRPIYTHVRLDSSAEVGR
jgi:hypothetical protein